VNALLESAQSLKSSSANLGAMQLSELSRKLEVFGNDAEIAQASLLLDQFETEFERARDALGEEFSRLQASQTDDWSLMQAKRVFAVKL